ncbi:hypothetical protein GCM10008174_17290 [Methylopila turkensis]|uniref:Uncharacterized protein n=1 Tax=Methylopila turkensis TaxID=1437816 RepID=A0A9W6JQY7_9HYPH|nr:hypothetical protein GCM10008174_17290 [Methylopila turkensis]
MADAGPSAVSDAASTSAKAPTVPDAGVVGAGAAVLGAAAETAIMSEGHPGGSVPTRNPHATGESNRINAQAFAAPGVFCPSAENFARLQVTLQQVRHHHSLVFELLLINDWKSVEIIFSA